MINELKELKAFTLSTVPEGISYWQLISDEELRGSLVIPLNSLLNALGEAEKALRQSPDEDIPDIDVADSEVEPSSPPDEAMPDPVEKAPTRRHPLNIADEDIEAYMRERNEQKSRMDSVTANQ